MAPDMTDCAVIGDTCSKTCDTSGVPTPGGEVLDKKAKASLGGECMCSVTTKSPSELANPSTSDELMNYSDTCLKDAPKEVTCEPDGMATSASYDCDPPDGPVIKAHEPGGGSAKEYTGGTHDPS